MPYIPLPRRSLSFPGPFAALLCDRSLKAAAQIAVNFTCGCIKKTMESNSDMRYGVNFESQIPNLIKYLEL